ncbi:MAG: hypothetical protein ACE5DX_05445 [Candidatus Dojkabacteria bacterium]
MKIHNKTEVKQFFFALFDAGETRDVDVPVGTRIPDEFGVGNAPKKVRSRSAKKRETTSKAK